VTLNDFVLVRGRTAVPLAMASARITSSDQITYTITNIRGTRLAGSYTLRLKAAGTGIIDMARAALAAPAVVSWRMTRTVPALPVAAVAGR
jgi:hypothetical protein